MNRSSNLILIVLAAWLLAACSANELGVEPLEGAEPPAGGLADGGSEYLFSEETEDYFNTQIGRLVFFDVDQSALSGEAATILDGQAEWLTNNPGYSAIIQGHTDERGTREYNLALGARRANAVREYLVGKGIDESRIRTVTYGKERPDEACSAEMCWSRNRRAVTVLASNV